MWTHVRERARPDAGVVQVVVEADPGRDHQPDGQGGSEEGHQARRRVEAPGEAAEGLATLRREQKSEGHGSPPDVVRAFEGFFARGGDRLSTPHAFPHEGARLSTQPMVVT